MIRYHILYSCSLCIYAQTFYVHYSSEVLTSNLLIIKHSILSSEHVSNFFGYPVIICVQYVQCCRSISSSAYLCRIQTHHSLNASHSLEQNFSFSNSATIHLAPPNTHVSKDLAMQNMTPSNNHNNSAKIIAHHYSIHLRSVINQMCLACSKNRAPSNLVNQCLLPSI